MTTLKRDSDVNSDQQSKEQSSPYETTLISFVIPVRNNQDTLVALYGKIEANVPDGYDFELIFVDDGSEDDSWGVVHVLADVYPSKVRGIRFRNKVGKAAGLTAGFRAARGEVVFTMEANLRDDPSEIPRFLEKLAEGHDVVSGYNRMRPKHWHKTLPSRVYNYLLSAVSCVKLRDHNCGFKCYRVEVVKQLTLYGELHRVVPSLVSMSGYSVSEIPVTENTRSDRKSKYGFRQLIAGVSDMLTIGFLQRFRERPAHLINCIAFVYLQIAAVLLCAAIIVGVTSLPGMLFALVTLIVGGMAGVIVLCGLISEQVVRGGNHSNWRLPIIEDTAAELCSIGVDWSRLPVPCEYSAAV